jgi:hypothetical protein
MIVGIDLGQNKFFDEEDEIICLIEASQIYSGCAKC